MKNTHISQLASTRWAEHKKNKNYFINLQKGNSLQFYTMKYYIRL